MQIAIFIVTTRNVNGTIDREYFRRVATYLDEVLHTKKNSVPLIKDNCVYNWYYTLNNIL